MVQIIKETFTTHSTSTPQSLIDTEPNVTSTQFSEYLIYFLSGLLEILLLFRIVLKVLGANLNSGFVALIYGITNIFILPFEGIFRRWLSPGIETTSVFEPSTVVALIVYALLAWGIVNFVKVLSGKKQITN